MATPEYSVQPLPLNAPFSAGELGVYALAAAITRAMAEVTSDELALMPLASPWTMATPELYSHEPAPAK